MSGLGLSKSYRRTHAPYTFRGEDEPLFRYAAEAESSHKVDFFVFGHYHDAVNMQTPGGARLVVLKDWMDGGWSYARFDGITFSLHSKAAPSL